MAPRSSATRPTLSTTTLFRGNPASQGYCLTDQQQREVRFAVRFPTALCLPLVVAGLALGSPIVLFALAVVGAFAGFGPRHPFDYLWNHAVRHLVRQPQVPPNPRRRRHAFKIGTACLATVGVLFAVGLEVPALVLGSMLLIACTSATVLNFCVPSEALARLERA